MALIQPPMLTNGGTHPARAFRMMIRDMSRGAQGVTEGNDLKVSPLATAGAGVRVGDGSAIIRGATWGQGHYTQYNVGDAAVPVAPTGASARSDLVVLRVEDQEYEGNRNPATQDVGYFHVIPGVSGTATTAPVGMTAVPLARLDIPANTATITAAMIKDLRGIANPRTSRHIYTASPTGNQNWAGNAAGTWVAWPAAAWWNVPVPAWAVRARLIMNIAGVQVLTGGVWGASAFKLGTLQGQSVQFDTGSVVGDKSQRIPMISADTLAIPASMRGTTQSLQALVSLQSSNPGVLQADVATTAYVDVEFEEGVI